MGSAGWTRSSTTPACTPICNDFLRPKAIHAQLAVSALAPYLLTALVERPDRLIYLTSDMGRCRESTPGQPRVARITGSLLVRGTGRTPIDRVFLSD